MSFNYINSYNLKRYKPPESKNTWLKTVENPAAITQFAKLEPVIILESGLTRETCELSCDVIFATKIVVISWTTATKVTKRKGFGDVLTVKFTFQFVGKRCEGQFWRRT